MMMRFVIWSYCVLSFSSVLAQKNVQDTLVTNTYDTSFENASDLTVRAINISGNKRTKVYIIERELAFEKGKTYSGKDFNRRIKLTKEQLINTTLFVDVAIHPAVADKGMVDVDIEVKERWYFFPLPYFKVTDRNWNEWINTHKADFSRVNYGLKLSENNLSGRNDKLNVWLIGGYTQQISFNYTQPYLDPKLRHGMFIGFQYARSREVNYATDYDTLKFLKLPDFARTTINAYVGYTYRKGSKERHSVRLSYTSDKIDSVVIKENRDFFGSGRSRLKYVGLHYGFQYFNVDYIRYPLRGWYVDVFADEKIARSFHLFSIGGKYLRTWQLSPKSYFMVQVAGTLKLPFKQPYYNAHLLGYNDFTMRGLEYMVVDGIAGICLKNTFRRKLFGFTLRSFSKSKTHNRIPFTFYGKVYNDIGYVYDKYNYNNSRLANKWLYTGGIGLDIVTVYDIVLKLEFSFNQLGKKGLYYHTGAEF